MVVFGRKTLTVEIFVTDEFRLSLNCISAFGQKSSFGHTLPDGFLVDVGDGEGLFVGDPEVGEVPAKNVPSPGTRRAQDELHD